MASGEFRDLPPRQGHAGRGVRIGQDDGSGRSIIVVDADTHLAVQGHRLMADAEKAAIDRIKAVGDVWKEQRLLMTQQTGEGMGENLV